MLVSLDPNRTALVVGILGGILGLAGGGITALRWLAGKLGEVEKVPALESTVERLQRDLEAALARAREIPDLRRQVEENRSRLESGDGRFEQLDELMTRYQEQVEQVPLLRQSVDRLERTMEKTADSVQQLSVHVAQFIGAARELRQQDHGGGM